MQKLSRTSSGQRHLRWAREIAATMRAHMEFNYRLSDVQKAALAEELARLDARIALLRAAVEPYRAFIGEAHVDVRARQRVGDFLCDEAQRDADGGLRRHKSTIDKILAEGYAAIWSRTPMSRVLRAGREATVRFAERASGLIRSLPAVLQAAPLADELDRAAALFKGFNAQAEALEGQRLPLRVAVQKEVYELRELLDQIDGRLRSHFSEAFIDSLYPELAKGGATVADEPDDEDDTSDPPEG